MAAVVGAGGQLALQCSTEMKRQAVDPERTLQTSRVLLPLSYLCII